MLYIHGPAQDHGNSSAAALELTTMDLPQFYAKQRKYSRIKMPFFGRQLVGHVFKQPLILKFKKVYMLRPYFIGKAVPSGYRGKSKLSYEMNTNTTIKMLSTIRK